MIDLWDMWDMSFNSGSRRNLTAIQTYTKKPEQVGIQDTIILAPLLRFYFFAK
jgi:hypothetical protein